MELLNISFKVPPEVRQRLKLNCVLNNVNMADVLTGWDTIRVHLIDFLSRVTKNAQISSMDLSQSKSIIGKTGFHLSDEAANQTFNTLYGSRKPDGFVANG
jgi:hypothetical protein